MKSKQVRDLVNGIGLGGDDRGRRQTKALNSSVCYINRFRFCIGATMIYGTKNFKILQLFADWMSYLGNKCL